MILWIWQFICLSLTLLKFIVCLSFVCCLSIVCLRFVCRLHETCFPSMIRLSSVSAWLSFIYRMSHSYLSALCLSLCCFCIVCLSSIIYAFFASFLSNFCSKSVDVPVDCVPSYVVWLLTLYHFVFWYFLFLCRLSTVYPFFVHDLSICRLCVVGIICLLSFCRWSIVYLWFVCLLSLVLHCSSVCRWLPFISFKSVVCPKSVFCQRFVCRLSPFVYLLSYYVTWLSVWSSSSACFSPACLFPASLSPVFRPYFVCLFLSILCFLSLIYLWFLSLYDIWDLVYCLSGYRPLLVYLSSIYLSLTIVCRSSICYLSIPVNS